MRTKKKKDTSSFKKISDPESYAEAIISELENEVDKEFRLISIYFDSRFVRILESRKGDLKMIARKGSEQDKKKLLETLREYEKTPGLPIGRRKYLTQKEKEAFLDKMLNGKKAKNIALSFVSGLIHIPIEEEIELSEL